VHATVNQDQEAPVPGLDGYFAVSDEVAGLLASHGLACDGVIPQPIDTIRFRSARPVGAWPPRVLAFGNYQRWVPLIEDACRQLGAPVAVLGGPTDDNGRRWVLEAMACERNAVICSGWDPDLGYGLDGFVTPETYDTFQRTNCTGNVRRRRPTVAGLMDEIRRYDPGLGPSLRETVQARHAPLVAIAPLLDWTRRVTGRVL
jgi:hypothetical protein